MIILLDTETCAVSDADTLTDLRVVTGIDDPSALADAIRAAGLGAMGPGDDDHVSVDIARLRTLARASATLDDWDERFDSMIAYADGKGWVSGDGTAVRAHVERSS